MSRPQSQLETPSKTWDSVCRELQTQIIKGIYMPRERLVEDDVIALTGATRHAVRKAFDELVRLGLVQRKPNKGVHVRDYSVTEVEELYEIRTCLEIQAAYRFSLPVSQQVLKKLTNLAEYHREASQNQQFSEVFSLNNQFHETLYAASGNTLLAEAIQQYTFATHPIRTRGFSNQNQRELAVADHFAMLEAIKLGENTKLADIIRDHIRRPKDFYLKIIAGSSLEIN